jgi:hypothetical protein
MVYLNIINTLYLNLIQFYFILFTPKNPIYGIGKRAIILYEKLFVGNVLHNISKHGVVKQNALFEYR